jgi:hypothetical protein
MKTMRFVTIPAILLLMVGQRSHGQPLVYDIAWRTASVSSLDQPVPAAVDYVDSCATGCEEPRSCCARACCASTWRFFAELQYLRPRDAEVPYAVAVDGAIIPPGGVAPVQVGGIGMVDPDAEPGVRAGFALALDDCAELVAAFTHFESSTSHRISVPPGDVIRSLVFHPATASAAADFLDAGAAYGVDFQLADLDYRRTFSCGAYHTMSYTAGVRYAHIEQDFGAVFTDFGTETIDTSIAFDGGGIRVGWEGERYAPCFGLMAYGRAAASFVAGEFSAHYFQGEAFDPEVVNTNWKVGRIVTMLELELGVGWVSPCNRYRFTTGYLVNSWMNAVKTADWIGAVQINDFSGLGDTMTFDGLVARAEVRY